MHSTAKLLSRAATAAAFLALLAVPAQAQVNTGSSATSGGFDVFWSFVTGQATNPSVGTAAWIIDTGAQHPNWVEPTSDSRWITGQPGWETTAPDNFWTTYFMSFNVDAPGTLTMTGRWATDNNAVMYLNGTQVATSGFTSFGSLTDFAVNENVDAGTNTLAVQVWNGAASTNPTGLLISDMESNVVPEPMTFVLLGTGLLGLAIVGRRRREGELAE